MLALVIIINNSLLVLMRKQSILCPLKKPIVYNKDNDACPFIY